MTGMPHNKRLLAGTVLGDFAFVQYTQTRHGNAYAIFRCLLCGELRERVVSQVRTGYVKNCHCQKPTIHTRHGHAVPGVKSPTYDAWAAMKKRCLNTGHKLYAGYGGRGITVCDRWMVFENFLEDMGVRPDGMSLDRIDNNSGYCKDNCRWADIRTQNNNKRGNTLLSLHGKTMTISQWSAETGIKDCTISERLRHGWSVEKTLTTPTRKYQGRHAMTPPAAS